MRVHLQWVARKGCRITMGLEYLSSSLPHPLLPKRGAASDLGRQDLQGHTLEQGQAPLGSFWEGAKDGGGQRVRRPTNIDSNPLFKSREHLLDHPNLSKIGTYLLRPSPLPSTRRQRGTLWTQPGSLAHHWLIAGQGGGKSIHTEADVCSLNTCIPQLPLWSTFSRAAALPGTPGLPRASETPSPSPPLPECSL